MLALLCSGLYPQLLYLCQEQVCATASVQAGVRRRAGSWHSGVGHLAFEGQVLGYLDVSCPTSDSMAGECVEAPSICCIAVVFSTLGY